MFTLPNHRSVVLPSIEFLNRVLNLLSLQWVDKIKDQACVGA